MTSATGSIARIAAVESPGVHRHRLDATGGGRESPSALQQRKHPTRGCSY